MRLYEALMCKSIPIVNTHTEMWRTQEERDIPYKYYLDSDANIHYRKDWVQHNYELFINHHTLA